MSQQAAQTCPDCGNTGTLFIDTDKQLTCQECGYKAAPTTDDHPAPFPPKKYVISDGMPNSMDIDRWARTKYRSAMAFLRQEKWAEAVKSLQQAIEQEPHFPDAYIWLARLTNDAERKRELYGKVVTYIPSHLEAMRELMVLDGELTREEADSLTSTPDKKQVKTAAHPVKVTVEEMVCSSCGGILQARSDQSDVRCQSCGHVEVLDKSQKPQAQIMAMAILKERAQGGRWRVGKHFLHCNSCGAERVITSRDMTGACPFCGLTHVVKADALDSFRQPDGIIPFAVTQEQAEEALQGALGSVLERFKGFFINNRPDSIVFERVYLPFWQFDVSANIIRTRTPSKNESDRNYKPVIMEREEFTDAMFNLFYCAVDSPPHYLTNRLPDYDLDTVKPYDPKLLANITTELYSIDYEKASMGLRDRVRDAFSSRHGRGSDVKVRSMVTQMTFQLVMCPVWFVRIIEEDGDIRLALIHGQNGRVALDRARKPE